MLTCVAGKVYFEVTVVEAAGDVCVGWAITSFIGTTVGIDKEGASWGVYKNGSSYHRRTPSRPALLLESACLPFPRPALLRGPLTAAHSCSGFGGPKPQGPKRCRSR